MVEVKTARYSGQSELISENQKKRLNRAAEYLYGKLGEVPRVILAAVNHSGQVELMPLE